MQGSGDAAQHAERVALVSGRFERADLLLGGIETFGQFLLGDAGFFAQARDLERHTPGFSGGFEALGEVTVAELFLQE